MYSKNGEIRRDETCLDYSGHDVVLYPCHGAKGNQLWLYDARVSIYGSTNKYYNFQTRRIIKNVHNTLFYTLI